MSPRTRIGSIKNKKIEIRRRIKSIRNINAVIRIKIGVKTRRRRRIEVGIMILVLITPKNTTKRLELITRLHCKQVILLMARKELLLFGGFDIPFFMYAVMFSFSKFC